MIRQLALTPNFVIAEIGVRIIAEECLDLFDVTKGITPITRTPRIFHFLMRRGRVDGFQR
jgi:hypothetical protein